LLYMPSLNDSIITRKQLRGSLPGITAQADGTVDVESGAADLKYWRSLEELAATPEFEQLLQREFSAVATEVIEPSTRRTFLKYMGASLALAGIGLTGCRWPEEKIAPFANKQQGYKHGEPVLFATALDIGGVATGLLATSYDGRPVKIEGNPLHSGSKGAASSFHQASLLDLYDANRAKLVKRSSPQSSELQQSSMVEFTSLLASQFISHRLQQGSRLAVLSEAHSSPTRERLQSEMRAMMPLAQWYEYEPLSWDSVREGSRIAFGQSLRPHYDLERADVIVSFGCDFLENHPDSLRMARDWAKRRRGHGLHMNRVYQVEGSLTLSGAKADHRLLVRPSRLEECVYVLAAQLNQRLGLGLPAAILAQSKADFVLPEQSEKSWQALVNDLATMRGKSVIIADRDCSPQCQALVFALNHLLGNIGSTVTLTPETQPDRLTHSAAISELANRLRDDAIDTLVILGGNPAYDAPADLEIASLISGVRNSIHLTLHENETSAVCSWVIPRAHYLEEWGDARGYDGSYSIIQPLIQPLYGGTSPIELLNFIVEGSMIKGYDLARKTFASQVGGADIDSQWRKTLHDGVLANSTFVSVQPSGVQFSALKPPTPRQTGDLELQFTSSYAVYDGRFSNNGWLQETPDPLTKLVWDNACVIGVEDSAALGLKQEDIVELDCGGRKVTLPVFILPGQPKGVVAAALGYGRTRAGDLGNGVGSNLYPLRTSGQSAWAPITSPLRKTGRRYDLAGTQDHHAIDMRGFEERNKRISTIVREANVDFYNSHRDFPKHMVHTPGDVSRWIDWKYEGHRWGMSIDLATCTGCSACVVACTAENNIPVVGKLRVRQGREMHWLRIDRYFRADPADPRKVPSNPRVAMIPITCQQCELAPCEQVCPVNATVHSDEGLNDMVYNRCIGTRYCSNNCPFKVRRFNYFNYQKSLTETQKLVHNPEVTIRSRGVMEKCTYCVQRIQKHKIAAKVSGEPLKDGVIKTACQQACPTEAIVFGDLSDTSSRVFDLGNEDRSYTLLAELQLRPRTHYLAGLWNPAQGTDEYAVPPPKQYAHHGGSDDGHGGHTDHGNGAAHSNSDEIHGHENDHTRKAEEAAHAGH
jgi:molybdopterin-containing oxidoreductase family iron-sulfur binding subunit